MTTEYVFNGDTLLFSSMSDQARHRTRAWEM